MLFITAERKLFPESATSSLTPVLGRPGILSPSCTTAFQLWCSWGSLSNSSFLSLLCVFSFLFLPAKETDPLHALLVGAACPLPMRNWIIAKKLKPMKQSWRNSAFQMGVWLSRGWAYNFWALKQALKWRPCVCFCLLTQSPLGAHQHGCGSGVNCSQYNQVQGCN